MTLRTPLAVTAAVAAVLALPTAAQAADTSTTYEAGDAAPTVDVVALKLSSTSTAYKAVVRYTDLKKDKNTRQTVQFFPDASPNQQRSARGIGYFGNVVELRTTAGGSVKTVNWEIDYNDQRATKSPCAGVTGVPDYARDKITFTIPRACWYVNTGTARVNVDARSYKSTPTTTDPTYPDNEKLLKSVDSTGSITWDPEAPAS